MSLDRLEAFTEFAQHLETEHDIPFTALRCKTLCVGDDRDLVALCCNDQGDYPHTICEYDDEHGIFYYQLVGDNKYYYRLKKNDDTVDNKDVLKALRDECNIIFDEIDKHEDSIKRFLADVPYILSRVAALKKIINATEKE